MCDHGDVSHRIMRTRTQSEPKRRAASAAISARRCTRGRLCSHSRGRTARLVRVPGKAPGWAPTAVATVATVATAVATMAATVAEGATTVAEGARAGARTASCKPLPRRQRRASRTPLPRRQRRASRTPLPRRQRRASRTPLPRRQRRASRTPLPRRQRRASRTPRCRPGRGCRTPPRRRPRCRATHTILALSAPASVAASAAVMAAVMAGRARRDRTPLMETRGRRVARSLLACAKHAQESSPREGAHTLCTRGSAARPQARHAPWRSRMRQPTTAPCRRTSASPLPLRPRLGSSTGVGRWRWRRQGKDRVCLRPRAQRRRHDPGAAWRMGMASAPPCASLTPPG